MTKILIDRSVLEQALETLESGIQYDYHGNPYSDNDAARCVASDALRAALEQPQGEVVVTTNQQGRCVAVTRQDEEGRILSVVWESKQPQVEQEPVAWMYDWDADGAPVRDWVSRDYGEAHSPTNGCHNIRPLYTHPQNLNCKSNQARLATLWGYVKEQPQPQSGGIPPDWKRRLGNLLAVIHGDGGHYIDAHGWEKAQADAEKKIAKVMTDSAQSKPVAYRHLHEDGWEYYDAPTGSDCDDCQPLYTHPQPRQPLTDAEILMVLDAADIPDLPRDFKDVDIDIARAIEAAHEIGGEA